MAKLAFLGLGVMGYPMAGHLARAGHDVTVYNRTGAKAEKWCAQYGGRSAAKPEDAAANAEVVLMCVGNDDDVRQVAGRALTTMKAGTILVDHTTASAEVARETHAAAKSRAIGFLDAPVSGGQAGAENGKLTIMVGGDADVYARAESLLATYARAVTHMGPAGNGQLTKMVNQITIAGLVQGLAEGVDFALRSGLDAERVIDVISKGAAQSWQMENRAKTMIADKYDFGFAVDWMRKDLGICLAEARRNGATLPVTSLVDQFYGQVQAMGGGRWDTSSLLRALQAPRKR
ncbi:MAG: NAD(P)-dependent oxidoreductase [Betaproteobacteria bacterium]|jgi:3-hydroxyisobutyrate dehydrogenase-like beta-hydroxyacid dehydrogenase|nr:NAD(P)-dependent oxidoreductase [Betaproteobacteria bacterium]MDH5287301.1 NAD(P)-dependent oxidoreductase [Betaproteobacteria bacterium]